MNYSKVTASIFRFTLLLAAGSLVIYCALRYAQNHNSSSIEYKTFHETAKDLYPSINLCFYGLEIYDHKRMEQDYGIRNVLDYSRYLSGEKWNDSMMDVDYDYVTDHLTEYFNEINVSFDFLGNNPAYQWVNPEEKRKQNYSIENEGNHSQSSFPFSISQRSSLTKCFAFDMSTKRLTKTRGKTIRLLNFDLNITKSLNLSLFMSMNYPGQALRGIPLNLEFDKNKKVLSGKLDVISIDIGVIEVLRRRANSKVSCNTETDKYDIFLYQKMADELNCKPSHWKNIDHQDICNSSEKMKNSDFSEKFFLDPDDLGKIHPPCDELVGLDNDIRIYPRGTTDDKFFKADPKSSKVLISFYRTTYKEIKHFRAYNLESLIGNGGGYVGLFLGFTVWQFPEFCSLVYDFFVKKFTKNAT